MITEHFISMPEGHWTKGGTGITNFTPEQLPTYEKAIKEAGMERTLYIEKRPFNLNSNTRGLYSLHERIRHKSLSDFWKVFERTQKGL